MDVSDPWSENRLLLKRRVEARISPKGKENGQFNAFWLHLFYKCCKGSADHAKLCANTDANHSSTIYSILKKN